ncbi:hypothetical protein GEMRC1_013953 [Eukaryota sp. GEM-RC1]
MSQPLYSAMIDDGSDFEPVNNSTEYIASSPGLSEYILCYVLSVIFFPFVLLFSWFVVPPNEEGIITLFGKLRTVAKPGLHFISIMGRNYIRVSRRVHTIRHHHLNVADLSGSMLEVSGVLAYQISDSVSATLKIFHIHEYVANTSLSVLKKVVSRYPYSTDDGNRDCLQSDSMKISSEMRDALRDRLAIAGVRVLSFDLVDLQYDASIAKAMLVKQTSYALISARKVIVSGATQIVSHTVQSLRAAGVDFSEHERSKLISNLLAVICSSSHNPGGGNESRHEKPDYSEITMRIDDTIGEIRKLPNAIVSAQRSR